MARIQQTWPWALLVAVSVAGGQPVADAATARDSQALPALPKNLPGWLDNKKKNHIFYKRGRYNFDIYKLPKLAKDLNAIHLRHE